MRALTFWRNGDSYLSLSVDSFDLSPVYVTVATARYFVGLGKWVDLPEGYTANTLNDIAWITGSYGEPVKVSARQAGEVAQIARTLLREHHHEIDPADLERMRNMIHIITPEEP